MKPYRGTCTVEVLKISFHSFEKKFITSFVETRCLIILCCLTLLANAWDLHRLSVVINCIILERHNSNTKSHWTILEQKYCSLLEKPLALFLVFSNPYILLFGKSSLVSQKIRSFSNKWSFCNCTSKT